MRARVDSAGADAVFLTDAEIVELTGKGTPAAQRRALGRMGIRHFVRPDGRPKIPRAWIEENQSEKKREILCLDAVH